MVYGEHRTARARLRHDPVECKIDKLSDELLVAILSYLSLKEAATTSLISRRWRYLWQYTSGCLEFYDVDKRPEAALEIMKFCCNLKSLSLFGVNAKEEILEFFLSNCPYLEQVCVSGSECLRNLKVTGPHPSLKSMEISWCHNVKGLEIDAPNLMSFKYIGPDILVPFQNVPQLSELTIGSHYCYSFIFNADKHTSYSSKLRKLKLKAMRASWFTLDYPDNFPRLNNLRELELDLMLEARESLHFFTFFIKAAPLLS
ncbi:putative FBD-associated F-box protein At5g56430 [Nicotiana tabacum]|uniref:FBD-associated F-box protein At5g56430 n=1 Tax=Nicotiana tabacum TaxID=4097 RepID=A0AC58SED6_TOBAC